MTGQETPSAGPRTMRLRYAGRCKDCGADLPRGTRAVYDPGTKTVCCLACTGEGAVPVEEPASVVEPAEAVPQPAPDLSPGVAGASARREHERRVAAREDRVRSKHPKLGGLILALSDEPQTTKAWATGAVGEERLGRRLDALAGPLVKVLHDRGIPGSKANLDHLVVCASGVFVVDAKRYKGRPRRTVEGGLFSPRTEKLLVGRRDCTRLVTAGLKQADLVREALAEAAEEVRSVLCFVEADWPLLASDFLVRKVSVTWPKKLVSTIRRPGPLDEDLVGSVHQRLAAAFPLREPPATSGRVVSAVVVRAAAVQRSEVHAFLMRSGVDWCHERRDPPGARRPLGRHAAAARPRGGPRPVAVGLPAGADPRRCLAPIDGRGPRADRLPQRRRGRR